LVVGEEAEVRSERVSVKELEAALVEVCEME